MFIQGGTFVLDSRVVNCLFIKFTWIYSAYLIYTNWPDSAWYHEILFFTIAICRSKKFSVYKIYTNLKIKYQTSQFMCGSCHLGRLLNLKLVSNVKYLFTFLFSVGSKRRTNHYAGFEMISPKPFSNLDGTSKCISQQH